MRLEDTRITCMDLTIRPILIKDEMLKLWPKKEDIEPTNFRGYRRDLKRAFSYLANDYDHPRVEIERVCANIGAPYLYSLPGVSQIKRARHFVIENSENNGDTIRILENRFFDIGTNDTIRYQGRLICSDKSQITNLAETLGIRSGIVYQMAFIYALLHTEIPVPIYNTLGRLFQEFCRKVQEWGEDAKKIQRECRLSNGGYRIPIEEILPPDTHVARLAERKRGDS